MGTIIVNAFSSLIKGVVPPPGTIEALRADPTGRELSRTPRTEREAQLLATAERAAAASEARGDGSNELLGGAQRRPDNE